MTLKFIADDSSCEILFFFIQQYFIDDNTTPNQVEKEIERQERQQRLSVGKGITGYVVSVGLIMEPARWKWKGSSCLNSPNQS
jgi:hypothetical protein